jgi:peptidoglycan/LPS O-acetylase OafA/YrhL
MSNDRPNNLRALTSLRFFAAAAIVLFHLPGLLWVPSNVFGSLPLHQGVSFFYVLSGFILQHSYRNRLKGEGRISSYQFIALRFWRLWPCHIAVISLIVLNGGWAMVHYLKAAYSPAQIFSVIFLLQAWSPDTLGLWAINGPSWSISAEMFFYAMFPFLCCQALISPVRPIAIGAVLTFSWLFFLWLYKPTASMIVLTASNPMARIFEFTIGVSAYELNLRYRLNIRSTILEIVCILMVGVFVYFTPHFINRYCHASLGNYLDASLSAGMFAAIIVVFSQERGSISRLFTCAPMVYLGEISFALYLVHQPIIIFLSTHRPFWFSPFPIPLQVMTFIALVLGLSALLHHLVEKPGMSYAKKLILKRYKALITPDMRN